MVEGGLGRYAHFRALNVLFCPFPEATPFRLNISATYMGSLERGERNLTVTRMLKVAQVLKIDAADLIRGL